MRPAFDPFCLHGPPEPEPVEGEIPPVLRLVEEDEALPERPMWIRGAAMLLAALFAGAAVLEAATGRHSAPLVGVPAGR